MVVSAVMWLDEFLPSLMVTEAASDVRLSLNYKVYELCIMDVRTTICRFSMMSTHVLC